MHRKNLATWAVILFGLGLLFVEGGWRRIVALVGVAAVLLVGGVAWLAEIIARKDSN